MHRRRRERRQARCTEKTSGSFQQTHAPDAVRRSGQLESQQQLPCLGAPEGGTERAPTQNVAASLVGTSTGGANGPMPELVQRLLAEELKEWTLAQGERLGNSVHQLDYATRLASLAQLPCRTDDAVRNHWNRVQASINNHPSSLRTALTRFSGGLGTGWENGLQCCSKALGQLGRQKKVDSI